MKIIYDSEQPKEKRIEFIGPDGESYFGFLCFKIELDDGIEKVRLGRWGNAKERDATIRAFAETKTKDTGGNT